ncbi:hypothetical protein TrRE_jg746, partial [Triparma retinervis]
CSYASLRSASALFPTKAKFDEDINAYVDLMASELDVTINLNPENTFVSGNRVTRKGKRKQYAPKLKAITYGVYQPIMDTHGFREKKLQKIVRLAKAVDRHFGEEFDFSKNRLYGASTIFNYNNVVTLTEWRLYEEALLKEDNKEYVNFILQLCKNDGNISKLEECKRKLEEWTRRIEAEAKLLEKEKAYAEAQIASQAHSDSRDKLREEKRMYSGFLSTTEELQKAKEAAASVILAYVKSMLQDATKLDATAP